MIRRPRRVGGSPIALAILGAALWRGPDAAAPQERIVDSVTIAEGEALLIGLVDLSLHALTEPGKHFFLRGNPRRLPSESEQLALETIRTFRNKWFFFVKLVPERETTIERQYVLSFVTPAGRVDDVVTFPVVPRRCRPVRSEGSDCRGGIVDFGAVVIKGAVRRRREAGFNFDYDSTPDPDVRAAFERRFDIEENPRDEQDPSRGTVLVVTRRSLPAPGENGGGP